MKRYLLYLLVTLFALSSCSTQMYHQIKQTREFNIYESPDSTSKIVGTTKGCEKIYVYKIRNSWAEVRQNQHEAYIKTDALATSEHWIKNLQKKDEMRDKTGWMLIGIVLSMGILYFGRKKTDLDAFSLNVRTGIFNFACLLEILYLCVSLDDFMWFVSPDIVSGWAFLNIIILCGVALVQVYIFRRIFQDYKSIYPAKFSIRWGVWSAVGVIPVTILFGLWYGNVGTIITLLAFIALQVRQFFVIVKELSKVASLVTAILCAVTYAVGLFATILIALLAIVGFIGLMIVRLMISLMGRSKEDYNPFDPYQPF